jgi:hypothetical protein
MVGGTMRDNRALGFGGGCSCDNAMCSFNQTFIDSNTAVSTGAAVNQKGSTLFMTDTLISRNSGGEGGAVSGSHSATLQIYNCRFDMNIVNSMRAGGLQMSGGVLFVLNSLFSRNKGGEGGAMRLSGDVQAHITNVTMVNNEAKAHGGGLRISGKCSVFLTRVILVSFFSPFIFLSLQKLTYFTHTLCSVTIHRHCPPACIMAVAEYS